MWASPMDLSRYTVRAGDLLVSEGGDVGRPQFAPAQADGVVIQNSLHRLRVVGDHDIRFLRYGLVAVYLSDWLEVLCNKSTFGHLTAEKLAALQIPVPPVAKQRAIADLLDSETARIDALITKKRRMIDLLEERLNGLIDMLTVGHFIPLRRAVTRFVDYRGATPEKSAGGVPLVTATHIKHGRVRHELDPQFVTQETYQAWMRRGLPSSGDVVMTTEAPLGEVARLEDPYVALAQRLILFKVDPNRTMSTYLAYALRSTRFRGKLLANATGSTALGIKAERLKGLEIGVPPVPDQIAIGNKLRAAEHATLRAKELCLEQVGLLDEQRHALVTAAVTGAFALPGAAA